MNERLPPPPPPPPNLPHLAQPHVWVVLHHDLYVAPPLLVFLDRAKQQEFLRRWRRETGDVK